MKKNQNYSWLYFFAIGIFVFGLITKDATRFLFFSVIFLLVSGLIIQLFSGRTFDRSYELTVPKDKDSRLYWVLIVTNITLIVLAIFAYIIIFVRH